MIKPYAIQTVPYHENGTVGFSLRELIDGSTPGGFDFEVFYQDGRESLQINAEELTVKRPVEYFREYLRKIATQTDRHWSWDRYINCMARWEKGEVTSQEIEYLQSIKSVDGLGHDMGPIWMSGEELDAWEAEHIAGRK